MRNLAAYLLLPCLLAMPAAAGTITILSGEVDVIASSTAGRAGSSSGIITDDPAPQTGTSGLVSSLANAEAGPVPPGGLPTLPGTTGVAIGTAQAAIDFTPARSIATGVSAETSFTNMDGGIYGASAQSTFTVTFSVPVDTPYNASGSFSVDPRDLLWHYRLQGVTGFLVNNATDAADTGLIAKSGILIANETYTLSGSVSLNTSLSANGVDGFSSAVSAVLELESVCNTACDVSGGDADVDNDCDVDLSDLASLLANFGGTTAAHTDGDTDFDGDVDLTDLANVLSAFGIACP